MSTASKIAQDFALSEEKLRYTVNYGSLPHFKRYFAKRC